MDTQKQSIIDRVRQANNILVTVSANPSVDQLAACVGLTIMLNEMDKRATAVFSGTVPSTLEFLQPEETLEKNTDSLRDFIIALDKSKADKLRYKVEDQVVKIFITPYRTSISQNDLEFSQGDFNVEVVICLGVQDQKDLDQAIISHGRILHDATVISINTQVQSTLGTLNWQNPQASSLSEMIVDLADSFGTKLDPQIATALLTGVVAETDRFSNSKTSPQTMQVSAQLMAAGANQQLVATKLQAPPPQTQPMEEPKEENSEPPVAATSNDGTLSIAHAKNEPRPKSAEEEKPEPTFEEGSEGADESSEEPKPQAESEYKEPEQEEKEEVNLPPVQPPREETPPPPEASEKEEDLPAPIHINAEPDAHIENEDREFLTGDNPTSTDVVPPEEDEQPSGSPSKAPSFVLTPPTFDGTLTANSQPERLDPSTDPLSQAQGSLPPILTHNATAADNTQASDNTQAVSTSDENDARDAVNTALATGPITGLPEPRADLSAQPLGDELHNNVTQPPSMPSAAPTEPMTTLVEPLTHEPAPAADSPSAQPMDMPLPPTLAGPLAPPIEPLTTSSMPLPTTVPATPPPPVPPPFMPQPIVPNGQ